MSDVGRPSGAAGRRGLVAAFAHNPVAANLVMGVMLAGGLLSALSINTQVFPTIDPGLITITVPYPGATPTEAEEGITRRVEEAVLGIDGVERVLSTASENVGVVTVELKDRADAVKVRNDVETAVDRIADFPPLDAEKADIVVAETVSEVMTLVVSSELGEKALREAAEALEQALLASPAVSLVSLVGARDYEIAIEVREQTLRRHDLSIDRVAAAVRASSLNLSSGEIRTGAGNLLLRTNAKRERGEEFENIVLRTTADGGILRLGDVAEIRDGFADVDVTNRYEGRDTLFIQVKKSEADDVMAVAEAVKARLATYAPPPGIDVGVWNDETEDLDDRLSLLLRNGALGFALVFLFLVLMLDLRLAFWVAMAVPISFMGAFLVFDYIGVNINMVSLFGLIIVIGIVVDDAVVVGENIITEREAGVLEGTEAAIAGVRGVFSPVFVGVLTTMMAFAPLLLVTGTFGQILGVVPAVVIAVLTMSLIEAFFILPAHLAHGEGWSRWPLDAIQARIANAVQRFRDVQLTAAIRVAVRRRYLTLVAGFGLVALASALVAGGAVRFIFFPALEADAISANLEFPVGTPFATTRDAAGRIERAIREVNEDVGGTSIRAVNVTVGGRIDLGQRGPIGNEGSRFGSHLATVEAQLNSDPLRTLAAQQLERLWREKTGAIPGVEKLSFDADAIGGTDVEYELSHQDEAVLMQALARLRRESAAIPGLTQLQDSVSLGKRQYDIELTPAGEAAGLTPGAVARQLRQHFFGEEVHRIQRGRQELKVMVRYPREQRSSARDFFNVRIRLADGAEAPLSTLARVRESRGYSEIRRVDGRRVVTITGKADTTIATPGQVTAQVEALLPQLLRDYPGLQVVQAGFGREQAQDLASLGRLALIAVMVIYALLASQLKSYAQPFIVLAAIPFGAAGAFVGHFLLGYDLSFISIFGVVALSGVVINDSLVLVDRYNRVLRDTNATPLEAVVAASRRRFRAIFLTTATTALGLAPMLLETSIQAQFLIPMAVSLATGIVFASAIVLFLVPALLMIREDFRREGRPPGRALAQG